MPRKKSPFEKGKTYYYPIEDWKIKFIGSEDGSLSVAATQYIFRVLEDPEWFEFSTAVPEEIYKNKTEYNKLAKENKAPIYNKLDTESTASSDLL